LPRQPTSAKALGRHRQRVLLASMDPADVELDRIGTESIGDVLAAQFEVELTRESRQGLSGLGRDATVGGIVRRGECLG
jgi:hypothetical protein